MRERGERGETKGGAASAGDDNTLTTKPPPPPPPCPAASIDLRRADVTVGEAGVTVALPPGAAVPALGGGAVRVCIDF